MALTPANAFGRLEMEYSSYGKPHVARFWVAEFGADPGVGTFIATATPASLDALATVLSGLMIPLFSDDSSLAWGAWRGIKTINTSTGAGIGIVEGTTTPGSGTLSTTDNAPGAVSQITTTFRDGDGKLVKFQLEGATYITSASLVYSSFGGPHKSYVDYILGSSRIVSRKGLDIVAMVKMNFDTNDGLTRRYRR